MNKKEQDLQNLDKENVPEGLKPEVNVPEGLKPEVNKEQSEKSDKEALADMLNTKNKQEEKFVTNPVQESTKEQINNAAAAAGEESAQGFFSKAGSFISKHKLPISIIILVLVAGGVYAYLTYKNEEASDEE